MSFFISSGNGASNRTGLRACRVGKTEAPGMERLPFERDRPQLVRSIGVANFADQRMAAKARLDADLVALARMQADLNQARRCKFSTTV